MRARGSGFFDFNLTSELIREIDQQFDY